MRTADEPRWRGGGAPSSHKVDSVNALSQRLYGIRLVDSYTRTREYTGELVGVSYLYSQTGRVLQDIPEDVDIPGEEEEEEEEEDGEDEERVDDSFQELLFDTEFLSDLQDTAEQECVDSDGSPGYHHVMNLAKCLVELRRSGLVSMARILSLWDKLPEGDKGPLTFPRSYQETRKKGRFCKTKSAVHAASSVAEGLQSMRHQGSGPSSNPDSSRLVEAICILQPQGCSLAGARISRWTLILRNYCTIRDSVLANQSLRTKLQLFEVNQRTLIQWFNWRKGTQEGHLLQIGIPSASCSLLAQQPALPPMDQHPPALTIQPRPSQVTPPPPPAAAASAAHPPPHPPPHPAAHPPPHPDHAAALAAALAVLGGAPLPRLPAGPPPPPVPRTTQWKRRQREKKRQEAEGTGEEYRLKQPYSSVCSLCLQPKTKQFGHSRYFSKKTMTMFHFCQRSSGGRSVEEWLQEKRREEAEK